MIAAVTTVRDEADIVETSIRHLFSEGVDRIYVCDHGSTDGTTDILLSLVTDGLDLVYERDDRPHHHQAEVMSRLAERARRDRASWVVCFDADEFFLACSGEELAFELRSQPAHVHKLYARHFRHLDWERREVLAKPWPKVAFRPLNPEPRIWEGNHDVNIDGAAWGVIEVRELQYRSLEHFCRKVRSQLAHLNPALPGDQAAHVRTYGAMTNEELEVEWAKLQAAPSLVDPIRSRASSFLSMARATSSTPA